MTSMKESCEAAVTLRKSGLSQTSHRKSVLQMLIEAGGPLSAVDILGRMPREKRMNRVTVYRILASFKKEGIVREIPCDRGINYYEMACRHNPVHPHYYCRRCRTLSCLPPMTLSQVWELFSAPSDFRIDNITVNITGLCKSCQKK